MQLARRLYRAYVRPEQENIDASDLTPVFSNEEETEAAFSMFDRDLNGDISCEEMELSCVEIGRERKVISASLKDLDSVVGKLDDFLTFVVAVIVILVFLSLISKSTAGKLLPKHCRAFAYVFQVSCQQRQVRFSLYHGCFQARHKSFLRPLYSSLSSIRSMWVIESISTTHRGPLLSTRIMCVR